jgi:DNA-directed RNA polymerase subunit RPC12/RpoP
MFCSQCGKEIPDNSNLCEHCGSPIIINARKETSINNDGTIPKSETHQSMSKRILIVLGVILLIVGSLVFLFFFEKSESDKPTPSAKMVVPAPPVITLVPKSTDVTVIPKSTDEAIVPIHPVKTLIPKSTDETVVPKSTDETVIHKSTDETVVPKSADETVVPTPPSSSSD